jgi:hypothetical protein
MKQTVLSIEQSLESIAIRLDELTGNAMGNSYLKLDLEPVELDGVEDKLADLSDKIDKLSDRLDSIVTELSPLSSISETLENMLAFYIQFNENK